MARRSYPPSIDNSLRGLRTASVRRRGFDENKVDAAGAREGPNNGWSLPGSATRSISAPGHTAVVCQLAAVKSEFIEAALALRMRARSRSAWAAMRANARISASNAASIEPVAAVAISHANVSISAAHVPGRTEAGGKAMAIGIAAGAFFTGVRAGTGTLLGVAAVGGDLPFASHVQAAESFLVLAAPSSSTTLPSVRSRRRVFFLVAARGSSTTLLSIRRSLVLRSTAPNSPRYWAMRSKALSRRVSNEASSVSIGSRS